MTDYLEVTQNTFSLFCMLSKRLNYKLKKKTTENKFAFKFIPPRLFLFGEKKQESITRKSCRAGRIRFE